MGRTPCCDKTKVKKGPWSPEEDETLKNYLQKHGNFGNWIALPRKAGLKRCGKSCRLRWLNYLRPDIKHGGFTEEEDTIIYDLYAQLGSRWSVIASQLPGRTDNDVKNHWNTKLKKKLLASDQSSMMIINNNPSLQAPIVDDQPCKLSFSPMLTQTSLTMPPLPHSAESQVVNGLNTQPMIHNSVHFPLPNPIELSGLNACAKESYNICASQEANSSLLGSNSFTVDSNYLPWLEDGGGFSGDYGAVFPCEFVNGVWSQEMVSEVGSFFHGNLVSSFYADIKPQGQDSVKVLQTSIEIKGEKGF